MAEPADPTAVLEQRASPPPEAPEAGFHGERRVPEGLLISASAAILLLALMFLLDWYGVVGLPRSANGSGPGGSVSAWNELNGIRWVMLLTIAAALGAALLRWMQRSHGSQTHSGAGLMALGTLTALLLANRVLIDLPSPSSVVDVKLGAFLGLIAAIGVALGGYLTYHEEQADALRRRRRRHPAGRFASSRPAR